MKIEIIKEEDIGEVLPVLNISFATVAEDFDLTSENTPTNAAFININDLEKILHGKEFYKLVDEGKIIGIVGIEKSSKEPETYYIEKLAVLPEHRHHGYGLKLMQYAENRIWELKAKKISVSLIDENTVLKEWYQNQGYKVSLIKKFDHLPFTVCFMLKELSQR